MMIEKYLNKLEYNKILDLVSNYCSTYIGKDFVSKLMPLNNKDLISTHKNVVRITIILFIVNTKSSTVLKKASLTKDL